MYVRVLEHYLRIWPWDKWERYSMADGTGHQPELVPRPAYGAEGPMQFPDMENI